MAATTPVLGSAVTGLSPNSDAKSQAVDSDVTGGTLSLSDSNETPNVYIDGFKLPPHFPEDQLITLASPFGEIRGVQGM
jgi:hypothetical protein